MSEPTKPDTGSMALKGILYFLLALSLASGIFFFYLKPKIDRPFADQTLVMKGGKPAADSWLKEVRSGSLDKAHEATTPGFRGRVDLAAFKELVAKHPALKAEPTIREWRAGGFSNGFSIGLDGIRTESAPAVFTLKGELRPEDGSAPELFELVILKDTNSDRLLVDQFRFEPAPTPKP